MSPIVHQEEPLGKRTRTTNDDIQDDGNDLISELPHCVVTNILSRLPTKYAIRTSALSHKWKRKWTSIYNIDVADNHKPFLGKTGFIDFADVVTRLLLRTRSSGLRSFRLSCAKEGHYGNFETWVSDVLMRNVQYLDINAPDINGLVSPSFFSGWNLLKELKLELSCTLKIPTNNCFPNLKLLRLEGSDNSSGHIKLMPKLMTTKVRDDMRGRVTLVFPVLEVLQLSCFEWLDVKSVEIQAPELISVFIRCAYRATSYPEMDIRAPKLAVFDFCYTPIDNIVVNAPAVTFMSILATEVGLRRILKDRPSLKFLKLSGDALQVLRNSNQRPDFTLDQLKEVEVNHLCDMKDLMVTLQVFPPLESLIIHLLYLTDYEFEASTPNILSRLKKVRLLSYSHTKGNYYFVKYLLDNAKNLEEMSVNLYKSLKHIDVVEMVAPSLSILIPKDSRCKLVVEQKQAMGVFGPSPKVIIGKDGRRTRVVYPHKYWM